MVTRTPRTITAGLAFAEGPRWRDGRLWFSDMGAGVVLAVDPDDGSPETVVAVPGRPSGLGWLPDGQLLVVSMGQRSVLRLDGNDLVLHADLSALVRHDCNDMVVDGRGNAYVGNAGFDLSARPLEVVPAEVVLVRPDGQALVVDDEVLFPNGSVVAGAGRTLVVAETFGNRLTAFTIGADGTLADRRTWAELPGRSPDGICLDAEGAIWVADASSSMCVRVRKGGEVIDEVDVGPLHAFACTLGGAGGTTLFVCAAEGFTGAAMKHRSAAIVAVDVDVPGAGSP
ncbi:MAG: SMP-30/gluconolactonase/LRE family protein [Actinomycetota bacterium]|nr:SMP-30/gluconolactonase/LRE family protein [Actinomycetota bacterium]